MAGHSRSKNGVLRTPMSRPSTSLLLQGSKTWMPATSAGMTAVYLFRHPPLKPRHAADPAVAVFHLPAHVFLHLGVRKNEERFTLNALDGGLCNLRRRQDTVRRLRARRKPLQQRRVHALRAENGDLDPVVPMSNRDILGKADRGVLGR